MKEVMPTYSKKCCQCGRDKKDTAMFYICALDRRIAFYASDLLPNLLQPGFDGRHFDVVHGGKCLAKRIALFEKEVA